MLALFMYVPTLGHKVEIDRKIDPTGGNLTLRRRVMVYVLIRGVGREKYAALNRFTGAHCLNDVQVLPRMLILKATRKRLSGRKP